MKLDTYCEVCKSHSWCGRPCLNRPVNNLSPLHAQRPEEFHVIHEEAPISKEALDQIKGIAKRNPKAVKRLPPMEHPEGEPIVGAHEPRNLASSYGPGCEVSEDFIAHNTKRLQALADSVKKRGRPRTKTPEQRKADRAEYMRKKRGAGK